MGIIILGLGPGSWGQVTLEAKAILDEAREVYLRTLKHPTVPHFPPHLELHSFDYLYHRYETLDEVYQAIIEEVMRLGRRPQGVIYAVSGHPFMGEATVPELLAQARREGLAARVVSGLSFLDPVLALLEIDPLSPGLQVVDALNPHLDPTLPAIIAQVSSQKVASSLKLALMDVYPAHHRVMVVAWPGVEGKEKAYPTPLHLLGREPIFDHLSCLYLPPLAPEENLSSFATLRHIMARLRAPDGCPWDREQTHASLKGNLLEEAYETLEALDEGDAQKLGEELGDLLMQIALHAQIAAEAGEFDMGEVLRSINAKLIHRHPHVFGQAQVADAREVSAHWARLKETERPPGVHLLASVPQAMPALAYSQAIQDRAAGTGFDWPDFSGVLDKLGEELRELHQVPSQEGRLREFGDVLFTLVNVARWLGIDAEEALRLANRRFYRRFNHMEEVSLKRGLPFAHLPLEEKNALWEEAKAEIVD